MAIKCTSHARKYEQRRMFFVFLGSLSFLLALFNADGIAGEGRKVFRAGAFAIDISPPQYPVKVNCLFSEREAVRAEDLLHARCLVLDDGTSKVAIVIVDNCMLPRELLDKSKELAYQMSKIPTDRMLISATHTHSAPAVMGCLGSGVDLRYSQFLAVRIAEGITRAMKNLAPARIGWTQFNDFEHTHCRRWILRPDKIANDPFGQPTARAKMHPGHQNPNTVGPSGPVDPGLSLLSVQSTDGRPVAVFANYSMHYYRSTPIVSADYFARFAYYLAQQIGANDTNPSFVAAMSQGTSGDLQWYDYGRPRNHTSIEAYSESVAQVATNAYKEIQYHDWVPLAMQERTLTLRRRVPDEQRLAWARSIFSGTEGRQPKGMQEIYAREQILISQQPSRELKLQAIRIGELGITAIPNEVYGITGVKIKEQSPLPTTFNITLANGAEGYIPPPEQHKLGGYTTWEARTASLEVEAEPKIVDTLLSLLEEVAEKPRRKPVVSHGRYAELVLASNPVAYWRLGEVSGREATDETNHHPGSYEDGIAFYLNGPSPNFSARKTINRAPHFAGGRMSANVGDLGDTYSVELWFWNGLPNEVRGITGFVFSREIGDGRDALGDHLGIGGSDAATGKLLLMTGKEENDISAGTNTIQPNIWNYAVLVRDGNKINVYLNGNTTPEITGESDVPFTSNDSQLFLGGRNDNVANFAGKIDEVAIYNRVLTADEIKKHYAGAVRAP